MPQRFIHFFTFISLTHITILFSHQLLAQQDARKMKIDATKPIRFNYKSNSWNKNSQAIDSAAILLRDSNSGKIVKIEMQESAINSSEFTGQFQVNFQQNETGLNNEITPEIYVPPQQMVKSSDQLKKIDTLIKEGTLLRKPYFLRTSAKGQNINVFDSRDQAYAAYNEFVKSTAAVPGNELDAKNDKASQQVADAQKAQRAAQLAAEKAKLAEAALKAEQDRARMAEDEKRKQEELKRKQAELDEKSKALRRDQASKLAAQAMEHYRKEEFAAAAEKFSKSVELDPETTQYYYQYGVSLYKIENHNKSLVILNMAQHPSVNKTERLYFMALNHMKLKEYDQALSEFRGVQSANDKVLSPSAAFLAGVIEFESEKYEEAKKDFEYVLDNSSDAKLDQQAEAYIEQIANIMQFREMQKKPWTLSASAGLIYDTNITSAATGNATDLAGWRAMYGATAERRWVYQEKQEFSTALSINDMYSVDNNFQAKASFQNTDPLSINLSLPYKLRGQSFGKPTQWSLVPGFETVMMNADGSGARETIVYSTFLKGDQTLVMAEDWFATYNTEIRYDSSLIEGSADDNKTATKFSFGTLQQFFQDAKKSEAHVADGGLTYNSALGANERYYKLDAGYGYTAPWISDIVWSARLGMSYSNYPNHTTGRADTVTSLMSGLRKSFSSNWSGSFSLIYNNAGSTNSSYVYNKFVMTTALTWTDIF